MEQLMTYLDSLQGLTALPVVWRVLVAAGLVTLFVRGVVDVVALLLEYGEVEE